VFGNYGESVRANTLTGGDPSYELTMFAPLDGGAWTWALPAKPLANLPVGLVGFDTDADGGALVLTGKGAVWGLLEPSANDWTPLESPSASDVGFGQGDLAVWTDYPSIGSERIRGWSPDGKGVRTLIDPAPAGTCAITVSPSWIVGLSFTGGDGCYGYPNASTARLWRSPRAYDAAGASVTLGPELPGGPFMRAGVVPVRSWGDYAGAILWQEEDGGRKAYFAILRLSSGNLWRIDAETGHELRSDAWTFTPTQFYYAESEIGDHPSAVRRMFRVELSSLDQAAKPLN
jgi:hypothetical protein